MIGWRNLRETPVTKSKSVSVLHLMSGEDGASLPCYYAVKNTDNQSTFRVLLKPFPTKSWTTKTKIIKPVDENGDSFSKWEFNIKPGKLRKSAGRRGKTRMTKFSFCVWLVERFAQVSEPIARRSKTKPNNIWPLSKLNWKFLYHSILYCFEILLLAFFFFFDQQRWIQRIMIISH